MDHLQRCDALAAEAARFVEDLQSAEMATPVATCPPWTLAGLTEHLGGIHRWVAQMVRDLSQDRLSFKKVEAGPPPSDERQLAAWLQSGADQLVAALRGADPDAPVWTWGPDKHVRWWSRRQMNETAVHRADAELALGREPTIDTAVALDAIDELLESLPYAAYFSPTVTNLRGTGESLHFHATDAEGEWMIRLNPDGFTWEHGHGKGNVAVRGAATELLLLLSGRRKPAEARFQRFGDDALLAFWLENARL